MSDLARLVAKTRAGVLIPISEASLLVVLRHRTAFSCAVPFPTAESFNGICNKRDVLVAAQRHGIAVPQQIELRSPNDTEALNGISRFPLILKPARSVAGTEGDRIKVGVTIVPRATELGASIRQIPSAAYPVLVQERIDGPGTGLSLLLWGGKLLAAFAHRRIREKPPSGGVSVLRESIPLDPDLLSRSLALLRDFDWQGVAMVEYKLDAATGVPYLMEINGRFWGSLQLAIDAGVNFPLLLVQAALGVQSAPVTEYGTARLRWEWGDVDHLIALLRRPSPFGRLLPDQPPENALRTVANFFRSFGQPSRAEVLRRDDPAPFVQETMDWLRRR